LSFSNAALAHRISWTVDTEIYSSDHIPIFISIIPRKRDPENNHSTRWNLKHPNWQLYTDIIEKEIQIKNAIINNSIPEKLVKLLTELILNTTEKTIGKCTNNYKPKVPWWNEKIKTAIKLKNTALNHYNKTKNHNDFIIFKKLRAHTKYLIKNSKIHSWQEFTLNLNLKVDPHSVWNKIKSLKGLKRNNQISMLNNNGTIDSQQEAANQLGEYFQKNSSNSNYTIEFRNKKLKAENTPIQSNVNPTNPLQLQLNEDISINEILHALSKCKSKSSGPDGIPYSFIHHLPYNGKLLLHHIYNKIWKNNYFPETWRNSTIIPLPKPNKNKFQVDGYRPISLINNISKILEKITNSRLKWYIEKSNYLSNFQNGFRKNKSTIDSLGYIQTEINKTFSENQSI